MPSRPLNDEEMNLVLSNMSSKRDQAFFILGCRTGFRVSELLSLTIADVIGKDSVTVHRRNMKGKTSSRTVVLHKHAIEALKAYISSLGSCDHKSRLFPFTRRHANRILQNAASLSWLKGKISTHSMRKSYAERVHVRLGRDIFKTQKAMGHKSISSTAHYLSFDQEEINQAILEA